MIVSSLVRLEKYIKWLLTQSAVPKTKIQGIITEDALATLREKLSSPLLRLLRDP